MKNRGKWDMKAGSFQCDGDSTCLEKEEEVAETTLLKNKEFSTIFRIVKRHVLSSANKKRIDAFHECPTRSVTSIPNKHRNLDSFELVDAFDLRMDLIHIWLHMNSLYVQIPEGSPSVANHDRSPRGVLSRTFREAFLDNFES
uniref:Uncharacterized protein n=1 Tax=Vespula pensylvanica TaxID=30213 RepID=A0A834PFD0_VESPE|nr:hypothetical protein H0235_001016 [Vespula pensylvanica]